jgi:MFS family permease
VANRDPRTRARAMGFLTAGEDAGTIVAPVLAGVLWTYWGLPVLLLVRIVVAALSELYALRLERRQRRCRPDHTSAHARLTATGGTDRQPHLERTPDH